MWSLNKIHRVEALVATAAVVIPLLLPTLIEAADYVGGEADLATPQVRLIEPGSSIKVNEPIRVDVKYSSDFIYCIGNSVFNSHCPSNIKNSISHFLALSF